MEKILFTFLLSSLLLLGNSQLLEKEEPFAWRSKIGSYMDQRIQSMKNFLDSNGIVQFKYDLAFNTNGVIFWPNKGNGNYSIRESYTKPNSFRIQL